MSILVSISRNSILTIKVSHWNSIFNTNIILIQTSLSIPISMCLPFLLLGLLGNANANKNILTGMSGKVKWKDQFEKHDNFILCFSSPINSSQANEEKISKLHPLFHRAREIWSDWRRRYLTASDNIKVTSNRAHISLLSFIVICLCFCYWYFY